jgi:hypothetical protein
MKSEGMGMIEKRNPFFNMGSIEDPRYFVNRDKEIRRLLQYTGNRMSCSIVGSRKIGKSSLVKQARRLVASNGPVGVRKCFWVYLNFDQMASVNRSGFWKELLKRLSIALEELPGVGTEDIDVDWEGLFQSGTPDAFEVEAYLGKLVARDVNPIVVMDEFERAVCNPNLDYSFYGELRALVPRLTYVTVTQRQLHRLEYSRSSVRTSPFFNVFVVLPVRLFSVGGAERLLLYLSSLGGIPYSPEDIEFLIDLAGCHPFYLQQAGYQLFERYRDGSLSDQEEAYQSAEDEFRLQVRSHFEYLWSKLDRDQRALLQGIAKAGSLSKDSLSPSERILLYELEDCALISETSEGSYGVCSRIFSEFVKAGSSLVSS